MTDHPIKIYTDWAISLGPLWTLPGVKNGSLPKKWVEAVGWKTVEKVLTEEGTNGLTRALNLWLEKGSVK